MSETRRIQALPLHLANQIAAGEVIERPASVVKELVENSIDALATEISIDIEGAGSHLIRVSDNGAGIHKDDLALALSRHATSKLQSSEQLSYISSLGFRGEALPSIASVSKLSISSKQKNSDYGWLYKESDHSHTPTNQTTGTIIEVRELFFNLPARKHFLRGDKTEQNHITTTLHRLALSQYDVGFNYSFSGSSPVKLPKATTLQQQQQRIAKICGKHFINTALYLEQDYDAISLSGWIASAEGHRPQTDINYFFINGRVIRDRVINHAIRQAYDERIPAGRYPAFVLYLTLPLDRVDINVHPTKHEVRFRDARLIHGLINRAVQEALDSSASDEGSLTEQPALFTSTPNLKDTGNINSVSEVNTHYSHNKYLTTPSVQTVKKSLATTLTLSNTQILLQRFVIVDIKNEHWLIDLQTLDQQSRQVQLEQAIESDTLRTRPILVPISLTLETSQLALLKQHQSLLEKLAVTLDFTSSSVTVKSIPSLLAQVNITTLITSIVESLFTDKAEIAHLAKVFSQLIPSTLIQSQQQAEQLLQQLTEPKQHLDYCRRLDQATLTGLF
jgi:DNA mismatch repair protein MutL